MNKLILLVIMFIANMTFGQTDKAAENVTNRMSSAMELTDQERSEVLKLVTERNFQRKTLKEKFGDDEAGFKIAVKEIEVSFNRKLREYVGNKKMKLWADFNSASKENEKELQNNNQDDILINLSIKMQEVMGLSDNEKEKAFENLILEAYKATSIDGFRTIHGKKGGDFVSLGPINQPLSRNHVEEVINECVINNITSVDILGFEYEMGLFPTIQEEAKSKGLRLSYKQIPMEVFEPSLNSLK